MMNTIKCDLCRIIIGYTRRTIKQATGEYLHSEKLTNEQKYQMMKRIKKIYCPKCYLKGIREATKEIKEEAKEELSKLGR